MEEGIPIDQFPLFFQDARLNFAENMLSGDDGRLAVIDLQERDLWNPRRYTWKELRELVRNFASALRSSGLGKGDVVACMCSRPA